MLPLPSQLLSEAETRGSSYVEADLVQDGGDYDGTLESNNASKVGFYAAFAPDFQAGDPLSDAAFCIYRFNITGYDRNPQVRLNWNVAPEPGTLFIALASWNQNLWRWFDAADVSKVDVGTMNPYISTTGDLALVVLCTGTTGSELATVRIGGQPPEVSLGATGALTGFVPLSHTLDASGSSDPDGEIVSFEWDMDGDGGYEINTGTDGTLAVEITEAGGFNAGVRVTDDDGLSATRQFAVRGFTEWTRSWGGTEGDAGYNCHYDGLGHLFVTGYTSSFGAGGRDVLLLKYDLAGNLVWQRTWGTGGSDNPYGSALDADGNLLVLSQNHEERAVVGKFNPEGELLWQREYGFLANEFRPSAIATRGTDIYFCGHRDGGPDLPSAVIARLDSDGQPVWFKRWNGGGVNVWTIQPYAAGIAATGVAVAGEIDEDAFVLLLDAADGSLTAAQHWGGGDLDIATGLVITGPFNPEYWVSGYIQHGSGDRSVFLAEYGANPIGRVWSTGGSGDTTDAASGLARLSNGNLVIGGWTDGIDAGRDGLHLVFNNTGTIQNSDRLTRPSTDIDFRGNTEICAGKAIACAGVAAAANNSSWEQADGSVINVSRDWDDYIGSVQSISVQVFLHAGSVSTPSGAVLNTGAGNEDAVVSMRQVPTS